jgi:RNA polymerase sigma-70 factor (sigma-E family)
VEDFTAWATGATPRLFRAAWLLTGDWHRAEDLVQDTLARLFDKWGADIDSPTAYAHTVLARRYLSERRLRRSTERPMAEVPDRPSTAADPTLRIALLAALDGLPPRDRAVLVLRYLADQPVEEVARTLSLSPGAVRVRASRALARLREQLGDGVLDLVTP